MQAEFLEREPGNQRAILLFLGWGMDTSIARGLHKPGYDIIAFYAYDGDYSIAPEVGRYGEIVVVAWSFGVRAAHEFLTAHPSLPVTRRIAVNGTLRHIDLQNGIPPKIFQLTLRTLSHKSVAKFMERITRDLSRLDRLINSSRTLESRRSELEYFSSLPAATPTQWDLAVISGADLIFSCENQLRAWSGTPTRLVSNGDHLIDFQQLLDREVVDKQLVAERFSGAALTYRDNAHLQSRVARNLMDFAKEQLSGRQPRNILEIGCGAGLLTELYAPLFPNAHIELWDIAKVDTSSFPPNAHFRQCDAEAALSSLPDGSLDLVFSSSALQWFNSPSAFLRRLASKLSPGGLAVVSLFCEGTCHELGDTSEGLSLNYPSYGRLVFEISSAYSSTTEAHQSLRLVFPSVSALLDHLRTTGVNALRRDHSLRAALSLVRHLPPRPSLTYSPTYLILQR